MPRFLPEVIDQMLGVIPNTKADLVSALESTKSSAAFASPETCWLWWRQAAQILTDYIPEGEVEQSDWQKKVVAIWMDEDPFGWLPTGEGGNYGAITVATQRDGALLLER
jgi:hypothetical protein